MAKLIRTWILGGAVFDSGAAPSELWRAPVSIRPFDSRRLGLLFVFTFCVIAGARPVMPSLLCRSRHLCPEASELNAENGALGIFTL